MPINVGYNVMGGNTIDLASIQNQQKQLQAQKQQQMINTILAVAEAIQKKKQFEQEKALEQQKINVLSRQQGIENQMGMLKLNFTPTTQQQTQEQNFLQQSQGGWGQKFMQPQTNLGGQEYTRSPQLMQNQQIPVMTFDEQGNLRLVPNMPFVPKGTKVIPPAQMETPGEKQEREVKTAKEKAQIPTADMRNLAKQAELQLENVKVLRQEAQSLPGGYEGIKARGIAIATRGKKFGNVYMYERQIPAFAAGLYRSLTGDNRLSDMDAQQRALPLLWNTSIDTSLQEPMFGFLEYALEARKKLLTEGNFIQTPEGDIVTPLETVILEAKKIKAREFGYSEEEVNNFLGIK